MEHKKKCKCGCGKKIPVGNIKFYSIEHLKGKSLKEIINKNSKRVKYKTYEKIYGKEKAKELLKSKSGKNSHLYKHGKGYRGYDGFTGAKKRKIKRMYNSICQVCKKITTKKYYGSCHHINYNKSDSRLINLIYIHSNRSNSKCHKLINKNLDYWFVYFCFLKNIEPEMLLLRGNKNASYV